MTNEGKAWLVMLAAFLAGVTVAVNQFKVPPVLPTLMTTLQLDKVTGGWLMSIFSVTGVFLALVAAFLLASVGPKITGMVALGCTVIGSILGATATNAATLLIGRAIEGISSSLTAVVAPAVISLWFEPRKRGLPMGIWAAWVPVGNVIMFNIAHPLKAAFGWRAIWWFGALLALATLVIFGLVVSTPRRVRQGTNPLPDPPGHPGRILLNPSSWILALTFGTFSFSLISYNTWVPSFLVEALHVEAARASSYASLMFVAGILANLVAGWLMNRIRRRHRVLVGSFVITGILFAWGFRLGDVNVVPPYLLALGFASNFIPTSVFTLAPETAIRPELAGFALATVNVVSSLGVLTGPPLLGLIISRAGWAWGSLCLVIMMGLGTIASLLFSKRMG
jgi:MFS family permease